MSDTEDGIVEYRVRRAVGKSALHKINEIAHEEQQAGAEKDKILRWIVGCAWFLFAVAIVYTVAIAVSVMRH